MVSVRDCACAILKRSGARVENTNAAHRRLRQVPHCKPISSFLFLLTIRF